MSWVMLIGYAGMAGALVMCAWVNGTMQNIYMERIRKAEHKARTEAKHKKLYEEVTGLKFESFDDPFAFRHVLLVKLSNGQVVQLDDWGGMVPAPALVAQLQLLKK